MNANELADSLDLRRSGGNSSGEDEIIIKSLRFAADMERLYCQGRCPLFSGSGGDDPMVQLSLYDFGERVHFYAEDIYSAARKAVEALEGE